MASGGITPVKVTPVTDGNLRSIPASAAIQAASAKQNDDKNYNEQSGGIHVQLLGVARRGE